MARKYFLPLIFCCFGWQLQAQDSYDTITYEGDEEAATTEYQRVAPSSLEGTKKYQSEKMDVQKFDEDKWKQIVGNEKYEEEKEEEEIEIKKPDKPSEDKADEEPSTPWNSAGLKIIFYVLVCGIVLLILWGVMRNISLDRKLKKTTMTDDPTQGIENIEHIDIDSYLERAGAEKNYRLAVRLYYLGLLKRLNKNGLIIWKKDKTNLDYLTELYAKGFHYDDIRLLTLAYEEIWYGERIVTEQIFHNVTDRFEKFFQKISTPEAA